MSENPYESPLELGSASIPRPLSKASRRLILLLAINAVLLLGSYWSVCDPYYISRALSGVAVIFFGATALILFYGLIRELRRR